MQFRYILVLLAASLVLPSLASAQGAEDASTVQEDELITDRPDFTESSSTVPTGRLQLEAGVGYTYIDAADGFNLLNGPNLLGRYGVADYAELRLEVPNFEYTGLGDDFSDTSIGEASLGAKFATSLTDEIRVGVIPFFEIGVESGDLGGGLIGTVAFDLTEDLGLALNAGLSGEETFDDQFDLNSSVSLAAAYSVLDKLGIFLESYALLPGDDVTFVVDGGVTYLVSTLVQLDAFVGTDVPDTDSIFGGAGISVLF